MKIRFWGLIAFDITAMYFIARAASFALTVVLVLVLLLTNILLAMLLSRVPPLRTGPSGIRMTTLVHTVSWANYIPVLGGMVCVFAGLIELSWKTSAIGTVAIAVGALRIWAKGRARQALRERR